MRLRLLLLPFTAVYAAVTGVRNFLYDKGLLRSRTFCKPVICIGNITVGGTGKTPFVEYLAAMLSGCSPSLVSRGYKRKTKGMVVASASSTTADIGDEPMQIHNKFPQMPVVVDGNRERAIDYLLQNTPTGVVLMDDGFQHRSVRAGLNILMMDYARPPWKDFQFPAGNLRESMSALGRADIIVVNKCPQNLPDAERQSIARRLGEAPNRPVFFSTIKYGALHSIDGTQPDASTPTKIVAVAGVGNPEPFFAHVRSLAPDVVCLPFADHCNFGPAEEQQIARAAATLGPDAAVVTTEKDAKRFPQSLRHNAFYIPIGIEILHDRKNELNKKILNYVVENK